MRVYVPFGTQWYPYLMRRLAERPANIAFMLGNIVKESVSRPVSEFTLGGYMAQARAGRGIRRQRRPALFGRPSTWTTSPTSEGRYGAALLFVRWSPGRRPAGRSRRNRVLAWGRTPEEAEERIKAALALRREGRARRSDRPRAGGMVSGSGARWWSGNGATYRCAT